MDHMQQATPPHIRLQASLHAATRDARRPAGPWAPERGQFMQSRAAVWNVGRHSTKFGEAQRTGLGYFVFATVTGPLLATGCTWHRKLQTVQIDVGWMNLLWYVLRHSSSIGSEGGSRNKLDYPASPARYQPLR